MPRSPKYPLQPLLEHRGRKVDAATAELGAAVRARETAEIAAEEAVAAERATVAATVETRDLEATRLAEGELRAVDLARGDAWQRAAEEQRLELARATAVAAAATAVARTEEDAARRGVAAATADRDVVEKDRARFDNSVRVANEAAADEEAEDIHRARKDRA